jgi:hypothetical protein
MSDTKRRLPVMKQTPEEEQGEEPRPPWHWIGFGAVATFTAWVPLLWIAGALISKLAARFGDVGSPAEMAAAIDALPPGEARKFTILVIGILVLAWLIGALFGGFVVGRWGGENAGAREAAIGGFAAALIAVSLTTYQMGGVSWTFLLLLAATAGAGAFGGRIGLSRRVKAMTPNMK